jgi:hypothetical protein
MLTIVKTFYYVCYLKKKIFFICLSSLKPKEGGFNFTGFKKYLHLEKA